MQARKRAKALLFGQKKRHTIKIQVVADKQSEKIICVEIRNGKAHDCTIFKETLHVHPKTLILADSGYRGAQRKHENIQYPLKHEDDTKKLTAEQLAELKAKNRDVSSRRMKIEHIICRIKRFKIVSERYRNRRKRFALRLNLICGIVNFDRFGLSGVS